MNPLFAQEREQLETLQHIQRELMSSKAELDSVKVTMASSQQVTVLSSLQGVMTVSLTRSLSFSTFIKSSLTGVNHITSLCPLGFKGWDFLSRKTVQTLDTGFTVDL